MLYWLLRPPNGPGADKLSSDSDDAAIPPFWDWCPDPGEQCPNCVRCWISINGLFESPVVQASLVVAQSLILFSQFTGRSYILYLHQMSVVKPFDLVVVCVSGIQLLLVVKGTFSKAVPSNFGSSFDHNI